MVSFMVPALVLLAASLTDAAPSEGGERLSSRQIGDILAANTELPPNCQLIGSPCILIRCTQPQQPGDWPGGLYSCAVLQN